MNAAQRRRWAGLALSALALACSSRPLDALPGTPDAHLIGWGDPPNRKIDLLFMIDDSTAMELAQANLVGNFPAFMNALKGLPDGLPDLHIAVITSDMGAGNGSITGCHGNGDDGVFRFSPSDGCTDTTLQGGATYITDTGGWNPQTNFTDPDITNVFRCIARVGAAGCGFEHQLASVARALGADGRAPPEENQGFLRPEALLAIVLLTNEDDCSAPADSTLFDTAQTTLASTLGPIGNFRCNEFGHLCGTPPRKPPRLSPNPNDSTTEVALDGCVSAEGQGMLTPVATFVRQLRALKADPAVQLQVLSIQGPAAPYRILWGPPAVADTGPWPLIAHPCDGTETSNAFGVGSLADPGVRLQQLVRQLGDSNAAAYSICETSFGPPLEAFAAKLAAILSPPPRG